MSVEPDVKKKPLVHKGVVVPVVPELTTAALPSSVLTDHKPAG